jgi:hypothetical protein
MVMPALVWIAFWSCLMGGAACWGEQPQPLGENEKSSNNRDQSVRNRQTIATDHPAV